MLWILCFLSVGLSHRISRSSTNYGPKFRGYESEPTTEALKVSPLAASPYAYPFMGLVTDYKKQCGGCFVTHKVVVTAAHCVGDELQYVLSNFNVILHRYQLTVPLENDGAFKFNVTHTFLHPGYNANIDAAAPHDVAVVVVNNNRRVFDGVDLDLIVRIDRGKYSAVNEGARLLGWGTTSDELISANGTNTSAKPTVVMKEMNLIIRPAESCTYREFEKGYSICAQGLTTDEIPCKGDSGGPLVHLPQGYGDTRYTFVGIVSFGSTNCTLNTVFARVAAYSDFIINLVNRFSPESPVASTTPAPPPNAKRHRSKAYGQNKIALTRPSPYTTPRPPRTLTAQPLAKAGPKIGYRGPSKTTPGILNSGPSNANPTVHTLAVTTAIGQRPITVTYTTPPKETDVSYLDRQMTNILLNLQKKEPLPANYRAYVLNRAFPALDDLTVEYYRPKYSAPKPIPTFVYPSQVQAPTILKMDLQ
ncbi:Chymotrypsin-like elastase member 1 [Entomophthora muscae]|uniref:Chymotrypsin-like elastase member 1 n=1 Tax=Entomophthora muscae TaxID=34485 RepID=A0ACC2SE49_9FUNG|nr:Chymotrypsin-like elastase member 1 [Entomophthora muscae]